MKVSVIMPVYNGGKYLKESIESILEQSYANIEFIIIDDGSTDNSKKIIEDYKKIDNRIIFVSRENKGLVNSLNEAIELATSKYIFRMDADDIAHLRRIERQLFYLERGYDLVASQIEIFGENVQSDKSKKIIEKSKNIEMKEKLDDHLFRIGGFLCHPTIAFTKDLIEKIGKYHDKCELAEDLELYMRCINKEARAIKIPEVLLSYRVNNNSKSESELSNENNLREVSEMKLEYIKERYDLSFSNIIIWGAGFGGKILEKILVEKYKTKVCFIDRNTKNKEEILTGDIECILIASQLGKFEIQKEIESDYQYMNKKYFTLF